MEINTLLKYIELLILFVYFSKSKKMKKKMFSKSIAYLHKGVSNGGKSKVAFFQCHCSGIRIMHW